MEDTVKRGRYRFLTSKTARDTRGKAKAVTAVRSRTGYVGCTDEK